MLARSNSEGGMGKGSEMTVNEANDIMSMWHVDCVLTRSDGEAGLGYGGQQRAAR